MFAALTLCALSFDVLFGYPDGLFKRIGHPASWIGRFIAAADTLLNQPFAGDRARRTVGVMLVVALLVGGLVIGWVIWSMLVVTLPETVALLTGALLASSLIAQRSLDEHVAAVAAALERDGLDAGRTAVARIVGRDVSDLDAAGVSRAAIESLSENFADGVVAPAFWLLIAGLPGALAYKAINTADSMIGHMTERHRAFGWASARLDDLVNLPASRLAAVSITIAAAFVGGASWRDATLAVRRDAQRHRSPNAGWPEAAMAGALGLKLAGPRVYGGVIVDDAFMGFGRRAATVADIHLALRVYRTACVIEIAAVAVIVILVA